MVEYKTINKALEGRNNQAQSNILWKDITDNKKENIDLITGEAFKALPMAEKTTSGPCLIASCRQGRNLPL